VKNKEAINHTGLQEIKTRAAIFESVLIDAVFSGKS
jgi:hypothetical protein